MAESTPDLQKYKKSYTAVAIALGVFTAVTVLIGLHPFFDLGPPGPDVSDILLGLSIASVKASLVALIFMHLNHERGLVYKLLVFTCVFFAALMALTIYAEFDPIREQFQTMKTTGGWLTHKP